MTMRRLSWLLLLTLAGACKSRDNTNIVVEVWSDLAVPNQLSSIRIDVTGPNASSTDAFPLTSGQLPVHLGLVPRAAKDAILTVTATGLLDANEIVWQTVQTAFVPGESKLLKLFLGQDCAKATCSPTQSCSAGNCIPIPTISNLPDYNPRSTPTAPDAGTRVFTDAGSDSRLGVDSGLGDTGAGADAGADRSPSNPDSPSGLDPDAALSTGGTVGFGGAGGNSGIGGGVGTTSSGGNGAGAGNSGTGGAGGSTGGASGGATVSRTADAGADAADAPVGGTTSTGGTSGTGVGGGVAGSTGGSNSGLGGTTGGSSSAGGASASSSTTPAIDCGPLQGPANGAVSAPSTTYQSRATYSCTTTGYTLSGDPTRTCLDNGTWSGSAPTCKLADCGPLSAPTNGSISVPTTTYNSTASYTCTATGYTLSGDATRTCLASGGWSGSAPVCNPVDCKALTAPENGAVNAPITTYNATATYSCTTTAYSLSGNATRTCQADGQWSDIAPTCELTYGMICSTATACPSEANCCDGSTPSCAGTKLPNGDGTNAGQFVVSGDGLTVNDTITGLVWQRDGSGTRTGCSGTGNLTCTWAEARDYCAGLTLGGLSGWRLPAFLELLTIVDYTQSDPSIDKSAFPSTSSEDYWTFSFATLPVDILRNYTSGYSSISFHFGDADVYPADNRRRARCVR